VIEINKIQNYLFLNEKKEWKHMCPNLQEKIFKYYENNNYDYKKAINDYKKIKKSKNKKLNRLELINKIENEVGDL